MRFALKALFAALCYFVLASTIQFFSADPLNYLPVWPPAGAAFLLALIWGGWPVVLGVFLASLVSTILHAVSIGDVFWSTTPLMWVFMAVGNGFQAYFAARFLKPYFLDHQRLGERFAIGRIIVVCGFIIPFFAATFINLTIFAHGRMEVAELPWVVMIWMSGNTIPIIAVLPTCFAYKAHESFLTNLKNIRFLIAIVGSSVSVYLLLTIFFNINIVDIQSIRKEFENHGKSFTKDLANELGDALEDLEILSKSHVSIHTNHRTHFEEVVSPVYTFNKSIQAITWIQLVSHEQRADFEAKLSKRSDKPMCIKQFRDGVPEPCRPLEHYLVIGNVYPLEGNEAALGLELSHHKLVESTIEKALMSGKPQLTPPIALVQKQQESNGLVIYYPSSVLDINDAMSRRSFKIVSIVYDIGKLMGTLWNEHPDDGILTKIYDDTDPENPVLMAGVDYGGKVLTSHDSPYIESISEADIYVFEDRVEIAGRTYRLKLIASSGYFKERMTQGSIGIVILGALIIFWLSIYFLQTIRNFHRTEQLVTHRTEQLKIAKNEAVSSAKAKSEFLAVMSHEIRTPMNGIFGASDLLQETQLDEEQKMLNGIIQTSTKKLISLINDILDFSKMEANKVKLQSDPCDIKQCCEEVIQSLKSVCTQKGLKLELEFEANCSSLLLFDQTRLCQVLFNLVGNAVKFTDEGSVKLELKLKGAEECCEVDIKVIDTGIGIPEGIRGELFKAFTQADYTSSRKHGGTGLGLAISSKIVDLMDGEIFVESEEGKGSTFALSLRFPFAEEATIEKDGEQAEAFSLKGKKILIVEDNSVNQKVIMLLLNKLGNIPDIAGDGLEALEKVKSTDYDLIFMDCGLPKLDGYACTTTIREELGKKDLIIVALTAHALPGDAKKCFEHGMNDYLSKPLEKAKFEAMVRKHLA